VLGDEGEYLLAGGKFLAVGPVLVFVGFLFR
jgi:hypothetical protein